ncbi:SCO family protein [Chloroflexia bacterium SDU3-3]|nr:SCO family protein [Chloroflexia bacterium SDU3-3]
MKRMPALILLALVSLLALSSCGQPYTFRSTVIEPAKPAPDFTLTDQNGQPFTLSQQKGNVVLLFFGFTSCPDVCPTTLADIAAARKQLGGDADRIKVALITVDPARDNQQKIGTYVHNYDSTFIGLTGTQEEIAPVMKSYGVTAIRRELPNSKLQYTMDHSAFIYVIDKDGNWRAMMPFGVTSEDIASDTRYLVNNS